jgi:hypothetical protein
LFCWNAGRPALASRCLFPGGSNCSFWTAALPKAARSLPGSRGSDCRPVQGCKQPQDKAAAKSGSSQATSRVSHACRVFKTSDRSGSASQTRTSLRRPQGVPTRRLSGKLPTNSHHDADLACVSASNRDPTRKGDNLLKFNIDGPRWRGHGRGRVRQAGGDSRLKLKRPGYIGVGGK